MQVVAAGRCMAQGSGDGGRAATASAAVVPSPRRPAPMRRQQQLVLHSAGASRVHRSSYGNLQQRSSFRRWLRPQQPLGAAGTAAAGGDAAGGAGTPPPLQPPKQKRPRELSTQQRWRAVKSAALKAAQWLSETPAVASLLQASAVLNARLQPLYVFLQLLQRKADDLIEVYNEFLVDETKRQWRWSKIYSKEFKAWAQVPPFLGYFTATLVYEAFVPVSFVPAVALPLYYAWVLWDDWWYSPIFLALLATAPMKWVPWAEMSLVWPGLI